MNARVSICSLHFSSFCSFGCCLPPTNSSNHLSLPPPSARAHTGGGHRRRAGHVPTEPNPRPAQRPHALRPRHQPSGVDGCLHDHQGPVGSAVHYPPAHHRWRHLRHGEVSERARIANNDMFFLFILFVFLVVFVLAFFSGIPSLSVRVQPLMHTRIRGTLSVLLCPGAFVRWP